MNSQLRNYGKFRMKLYKIFSQLITMKHSHLSKGNIIDVLHISWSRKTGDAIQVSV